MAVSYKPQLNYTDFKDLTEQIHFHSAEGKIWLGEQRMLLMNLTSLAAFRREIVNGMGIAPLPQRNGESCSPGD